MGVSLSKYNVFKKQIDDKKAATANTAARDNYYSPNGDGKLGNPGSKTNVQRMLIDGAGKTDAQKTQDYMKFGEMQGEELTGSSMAEVGQGRADVRNRLENMWQGNSAGMNQLKQGQADQYKQMRASQAMQGGGGQMDAGQQAQMQRQQGRDAANFLAQEKTNVLANISKEWRGAGSDILRTSGQYANIFTGGQAPPPPSSSGSSGGIGSFISGLFG